MTATEMTMLLEGALPSLKQVQRTLASEGIETQLMQPTGGCSSGSCSPKLWLAVAADQVQAARQVLEAEWRALLDPDAQAATDLVLDFGAPEMTCPACLTTFATGPVECPECGLNLA